MVNLGEGAADTRRRVALDEIIAATEQPEDVRRVLDRFSRWDVRLVTLSREPSGATTAEVTHEALITEWGRLRDDWLTEGRQDVRFARRITEAAKAFEAGTGGLWRPPELDLLRRYAERHSHDLTPLQREFLNASLAAHQAEQRNEAQRRRKLKIYAASMTVLAGLAVASLAAVYTTLEQARVIAERARVAEVLAEERAEEADRQRQIAAAQASGVQALWLSENGRSDRLAELAAALARESWGVFPTPAAHAAAQRLVRSLPLHRIEHGDPVYAVAFDPQGRWLATASADPFGGDSVRVIHADPHYAVDLLCARVGRNLSRSEWQSYLPGEPYRKTCVTWRTAEEAPVSESAPGPQ